MKSTETDVYMQQKEAIYYLAGKKCTWPVDSFIYRSPWQVSQKVSLQPCARLSIRQYLDYLDNIMSKVGSVRGPIIVHLATQSS